MTDATLSPEQFAYSLARTVLDVALAECTRRAPMPGPEATEAEVDAWLDASEAAHKELEIDRLSELLTIAEDTLLAWSFAVARKEAGRSRAKLATIATVEAGVSSPHHLPIRRRAIDLALRLAA